MQMNFYCPDFYHGLPIYDVLLRLRKTHPNVFRENAEITHIFGLPYNCIWNGGSFSFNKMPRIEEMERCAQFFYDQKIHLQLTCTNALLTKEDCYDRFANTVIEIFNNNYNEILITSPILEEYLRNKNLSYKFDRSIIAANGYNKEDYNKELEKYNKVVMSRCHSEDDAWLKSVLPENRSRVEILVNENCPSNCPRLHTHYYEYAKKQLFEPIPAYEMIKSQCNNPNRGTYQWEYSDSQHIYTPEEIEKKYCSLGYTEFKLGGRGHVYAIIKYLVLYLIKPEYQIEAFYFLLENAIPTNN